MATFRSRVNAALTQASLNIGNSASHRLSQMPPRWSDYLLHQLERTGLPEELDLDIPSWRVAEVLSSTTTLAAADQLELPPHDGLPQDTHAWAALQGRRLTGVSLDVDSGLVFSRARVIAQSGTGTRSSRDSAFISGAFARYQRGPGPNLPAVGPVAPLGDTWHHYHFLVETLPRAVHARAVDPSVRFVTSDALSGAAQAAVGLLGISVERLPPGTILTGADVVLVDQPTKFWPRAADLHALQESFSAWTREASDRGAAIYISRARSPRALVGEKTLENALVAAGVHIVYLEELPFEEQIQTLACADVVIGAHGAGLANIAFTHPGTRIVELSSGDRFESCYRRMAALLGLEYFYVALPGDADAPFGRVTPAVIATVTGLVG